MSNPKHSVISFAVKKITITAGTRQAVLISSDDNYIYRNVSDFKFSAAVGNSGTVFLGGPDVDNTWDPIPAGGGETWSVGNGTMSGSTTSGEFDLSNIYVDGTTNGDIVWVKFPIQLQISSV